MVCTVEQLLESGPALFLSPSSVRNGDWLTTLDFLLHLAEGWSCLGGGDLRVGHCDEEE